MPAPARLAACLATKEGRRRVAVLVLDLLDPLLAVGLSQRNLDRRCPVIGPVSQWWICSSPELFDVLPGQRDVLPAMLT